MPVHPQLLRAPCCSFRHRRCCRRRCRCRCCRRRCCCCHRLCPSNARTYDLRYLECCINRTDHTTACLPPLPSIAPAIRHTNLCPPSPALAFELLQDPDLHTALGVVYNLSRQYDSAVEAFRAALQLRPQASRPVLLGRSLCVAVGRGVEG